MYEKRGFLPDKHIKELIGKMYVSEGNSFGAIDEKQIQPASFEPRLSNKIYVRDYIDKSDSNWGQPQELTEGFRLEKDKVYRVPLIERMALPHDVGAFANPKSRIGRSGLYARLIADNGGIAYDEIPFGYKGTLSLELSSLAFDYLIKPGMSVNQIRFANAPLEEVTFDESRLRQYWREYSQRVEPDAEGKYPKGRLENGREFELRSLLYHSDGKPLEIDEVEFSGGAFVLHCTTTLPNRPGHVMYIAKDDTPALDLRNKVNTLSDFFEFVKPADYVDLDPGRFSLMASKELLHCPSDVTMITSPIDPRYGNFKADQAGFFDPSFFGTIVYEPVFYEAIRSRIRNGKNFVRVSMAPLIEKPSGKYTVGKNVHQGQFGVHPGPYYIK